MIYNALYLNTKNQEVKAKEHLKTVLTLSH
jgi:hypothetical protein